MRVSFRNLTKTFAGAIAVNDVSLDMLPGEVLGLVGANGAGKSTLVKILQGEYPDYKGIIKINGQEVSLSSPQKAHAHGIYLVSQELSVVPNLTVLENLFLGKELNKPAIVGWLNKREMRRRGAKILIDLRAEFALDERLENLSRTQSQIVEIAQALLDEPSLLILDEPTTSLLPQQVEALRLHIRSTVSRGATVLLVSHDLEQILSLSQRVAVLRDGKLVFCGSSQALTVDQLRHWMYGELGDVVEIVAPYRGEQEVLFEVQGLSTPHFSDLSFKVSPGEIVALVASATESPSEILRSIFGAAPRYKGLIKIKGQTLSISTPSDAIKNGIGYLPNDRFAEGIFLNLSVVDNITLLQQEQVSNFGWLRRALAYSMAETYAHKFFIKASRLDGPIKYLSGGNQQKSLLARWFLADTTLLLLDEPFSGIDIQGRHDLLMILRNFRDTGKGGLFVSNDPEDIVQACDRLILIRKGRVAREVLTSELTTAELTAQLTGIS